MNPAATTSGASRLTRAWEWASAPQTRAQVSMTGRIAAHQFFTSALSFGPRALIAEQIFKALTDMNEPDESAWANQMALGARVLSGLFVAGAHQGMEWLQRHLENSHECAEFVARPDVRLVHDVTRNLIFIGVFAASNAIDDPIDDPTWNTFRSGLAGAAATGLGAAVGRLCGWTEVAAVVPEKVGPRDLVCKLLGGVMLGGADQFIGRQSFHPKPPAGVSAAGFRAAGSVARLAGWFVPRWLNEWANARAAARPGSPVLPEPVVQARPPGSVAGPVAVVAVPNDAARRAPGRDPIRDPIRDPMRDPGQRRAHRAPVNQAAAHLVAQRPGEPREKSAPEGTPRRRHQARDRGPSAAAQPPAVKMGPMSPGRLALLQQAVQTYRSGRGSTAPTADADPSTRSQSAPRRAAPAALTGAAASTGSTDETTPSVLRKLAAMYASPPSGTLRPEPKSAGQTDVPADVPAGMDLAVAAGPHADLSLASPASLPQGDESPQAPRLSGLMSPGGPHKEAVRTAPATPDGAALRRET